jgi:predicted O-methyltransferase YrrM
MAIYRYYISLIIFSSFLQAEKTIDIGQIANSLNLPSEKVQDILNYLDTLQESENLSWGPYHTILPSLINKFNLKVGCEIGVSTGCHSYKILQDTQVEKLYSVDPYKSYGDPTNLSLSQEYFDVLYHKVYQRLTEFGSRTEILRAFSNKAASSFKKHSLDFVFLDANHTYEYVKEDLLLWYEKVKPGGIFAGDDYATVHPGVPQAVDEFFADRNLTIIQDAAQPRFWWIQKPVDAND